MSLRVRPFFARDIVSIKNQVRSYPKVQKHAYSTQDKINMDSGRLAECQGKGTADHTTVEPAISIDSDGLALELFEGRMLLNGFEKRQKT